MLVFTDFALEQFSLFVEKSPWKPLFRFVGQQEVFGSSDLMKLSYLFTFVHFSATKVSVRRLEKKAFSTILPFCCPRTFQGKKDKKGQKLCFSSSKTFPKVGTLH